MERLEKIRNHPLFKESTEAISQKEKERIYCGHSLYHSLDVARIMYIKALEQSMTVSKELIYACALLHDLGRAYEYTKGIPHDRGSAELAERIMGDCGFSEEEIRQVTMAISDHRNKENCTEELEYPLMRILKEADNLSRICFDCKVSDTCKWSEDRKNKTIKI